MTPSELPLVAGRYRRDRLLRRSGTHNHFAGRSESGERLYITEFFPVDLARRQPDGSVSAHEDDGALFERARDAFSGGVRALRTLTHPGILTPREVLSGHGTVYIVSDYQPLRPLERILARRGIMSPDALLCLLTGCLAIVEDLHRAGFVHGNLNAGTILVNDTGDPVLDDVGLWRSALGEEIRSLPGALPLSGTAIETFFPTEFETGPWTDVYGLAATAFYALSGRPPRDVLSRLTEGNPPTSIPSIHGGVTAAPGAERGEDTGGEWLAHFGVADLPIHVAAAVRSGLQLRPEDRPDTVVAWRSMWSVPSLRRMRPPKNALAASAPSHRSSPSPVRRWSGLLGNAAAVIAIALLAALVSIAVSTGWQTWRDSRNQAPDAHLVPPEPDRTE